MAADHPLGAIVGADLVNGPLRAERRENDPAWPDATPETTTDGRQQADRSAPALLAAAIISTGTLLLATFELSMADWPSGFVLLGILPLTALLFFGCCFWTATLLLRIPRHGVKFAIPFLICAADAGASRLRTAAARSRCSGISNWHRADRERIVARVEAGELKPNVGYNKYMIALGDKRAQRFRRR